MPISVYIFFQSIRLLIITVAGMDYDGAMIEVVFPISSVEGDFVCADVTIIDDDVLECEQDFTVFISSATLETDISIQPQAVVSIVDNDGK